MVWCSIFADFWADFRFRKHALSENGNAKFFFGVDFFEPSKGFLRHFEVNRLKTSHLTNPLKIRVFSAKSFLVENFRNMRAISRFWEASILIYFNYRDGLASVMIKNKKCARICEPKNEAQPFPSLLGKGCAVYKSQINENRWWPDGVAIRKVRAGSGALCP